MSIEMTRPNSVQNNVIEYDPLDNPLSKIYRANYHLHLLKFSLLAPLFVGYEFSNNLYNRACSDINPVCPIAFGVHTLFRSMLLCLTAAFVGDIIIERAVGLIKVSMDESKKDR